MENNVIEVKKTLPGFNKEAMVNFQQMASENPNGFILGLESKTYWEGHGGASLAKVGPWKLADQEISKPTRDFSIQFGAWKEVEQVIGIPGAVDRIEPVEAALAAMCACINWAICINSALEDITYDGLEITARAKVDPRVLFAILPAEESASCLSTVEVDIQVIGEVSDEDKAKIKDMAKRSPVRALIAHENDIITNVL